jgi:hypothetical protein
MPKLSVIVPASRLGFVGSNAELIRPLPLRPLIFTHRSRGNDSTAAWLVAGEMRITMIESVRCESVLPAPKPPAVGSSGSTHGAELCPVIRKFLALVSPA